MREIKAYNCDHCKKYSRSEQYMKKHEAECYYNPETRSCGTCGQLYNNYYPMKFKNGVQAQVKLPECRAGIDISDIRKYPKKMLSLQTQCVFWNPKIEVDEYL